MTRSGQPGRTVMVGWMLRLRSVIRALLDRIVLTPVDGKLEVDLVGDIAGIMALAIGQK